MQDYYDSNGLVKRGKCMYCLTELDKRDEEETADHFGAWCEVTPGHLKREARLQWNYVEKLTQAGWYGKKGVGLKPPSLLVDALPGREKRKKRGKPV